MKKIILFFVLLFPISIKSLEVTATSTILMDTDNNRILYSNNIHEVRSVASISKIMTAVLAIESGKLNETVTVTDCINNSYGSNVYLKVGEKLTLRDLVYALMLRSGNDASLAIACYVGGNINEFINMMNNKADEIKMKNTTFNNPNGLDEKDGNYSTAYDMALLSSYAIKIKEYKKIVSTKKYALKTNKNSYMWKNKNKLLSMYKYIVGGKTGYTKKAKRTLVSNASKDGINLTVVTLNDGNDFMDHKTMFEYAFNNYKSYNILKKGIINIYDDEYYKDYYFYIKKDFSYLLNKNESEMITLNFELEKIRNSKNNDKIGIVKVIMGDKEISRQSVYIKSKQNKTGIWISLKKWITNL